MKSLTVYCVPGTNAYSASQINKFDAFEKYVESLVKIIFFFWKSGVLFTGALCISIVGLLDNPTLKWESYAILL